MQFGYPTGTNNWTYRRTVTAMLASVTAQIGLAEGVKRVTGKPIGNPAVRKQLIQFISKPIGLIVTVLIAPMVEETAFRLAPSKVADAVNKKGQLGSRWLLGTVMAGMFSAAHNIGIPKKDRNLPVLQFISGMTLWLFQRRAGYRHTLAAHMLVNSLVGIPAHVLIRLGFITVDETSQ